MPTLVRSGFESSWTNDRDAGREPEENRSLKGLDRSVRKPEFFRTVAGVRKPSGFWTVRRRHNSGRFSSCAPAAPRRTRPAFPVRHPRRSVRPVPSDWLPPPKAISLLAPLHPIGDPPRRRQNQGNTGPRRSPRCGLKHPQRSPLGGSPAVRWVGSASASPDVKIREKFESCAHPTPLETNGAVKS